MAIFVLNGFEFGLKLNLNKLRRLFKKSDGRECCISGNVHQIRGMVRCGPATEITTRINVCVRNYVVHA